MVLQVVYCTRGSGRGGEEGWNKAGIPLTKLFTQGHCPPRWKKPFFFNLAQMHQWVGAHCSPESLAVIYVLFQLGEESGLRGSLNVLLKELPQFSSASKIRFRGSFQALWWMTNTSLAIHRRRIITFWVLEKDKAKLDFPHAVCGPAAASPATRWQPPPGTRKRIYWGLNETGSPEAGGCFCIKDLSLMPVFLFCASEMPYHPAM